VYGLSPFAVPDLQPVPTLEEIARNPAVQLFVTRARQSAPSFALTAANAPTIAEICRRLDGLPLAIELAASRIRMLSPRVMLTRLEQRLPMLTSGARDAPVRHRTLRDTIAWSYDLLSPGEQSLFRRLGVFVGGCTTEAMEAVASDLRTDLLTTASALIDNSLLDQETRTSGERRFLILGAVREFALEKLIQNGEAEAAQMRHAEYFLQLAVTATSSLPFPLVWEWTEPLRRLEEDRANLEAALRWWIERHDAERALQLAAALASVWLMTGRVPLGEQLLEEALTIGSKTSLHTRVNALIAAGLLSSRRAAHTRAATHFAEALSLSRESNDKPSIAWLLNQLGGLALTQGSVERAKSLHEEALALFRELGDKRGVAWSLHEMGNTARQQTEYVIADDLYKESLVLFEALSDRRGIASSLQEQGHLAQLQGNFQQARRFQERALNLLRDLNDERGMARSLQGLADVALHEEDDILAASFLYQALPLFSETGDVASALSALVALASIEGRRGNSMQAARLSAATKRLSEIHSDSHLERDPSNFEQTLFALREELGAVEFEDARTQEHKPPLEQPFRTESAHKA
jgi:tetratricopeptide (TPR) repeat protein